MRAIHTTLKDVVHVMKGSGRLETRVDHCEREIADLKRKVG